MLRVLKLCVALTLLSCSSSQFQNALRLSGDYLVKSSSVHLLNSHIAFLIGNVIVLILYLLSRQNNAGKNHDDAAELYGDYIQNSDGEAPAPETEETIYEDKQIVESVNMNSERKCYEIAIAIEEATKRIGRFERSQSVKLKRELREKPRRELRRSETENHRRIIPSGEEEEITSSETVENLSNEEFRRTIESFIEQQRVLWKQNQVHKYE